MVNNEADVWEFSLSRHAVIHRVHWLKQLFMSRSARLILSVTSGSVWLMSYMLTANSATCYMLASYISSRCAGCRRLSVCGLFLVVLLSHEWIMSSCVAAGGTESLVVVPQVSYRRHTELLVDRNCFYTLSVLIQWHHHQPVAVMRSEVRRLSIFSDGEEM